MYIVIIGSGEGLSGLKHAGGATAVEVSGVFLGQKVLMTRVVARTRNLTYFRKTKEKIGHNIMVAC